MSADPEARAKLAQGGAEFDIVTGNQFLTQLRSETASWKAFATQNGIKAQ